MSLIGTIREKVLPLVEKNNLKLVNVEQVKEYGIDIYRVTVDDETTFSIDIDVVASINQELLDLVNDDLPDGAYLEVTSLGIERPLKTENDYKRAVGEYIYIKTYEKQECGLKEFNGTLVSYDDASVTIDAVIKTRHKEITIKKEVISAIRLAVKF